MLSEGSALLLFAASVLVGLGSGYLLFVGASQGPDAAAAEGEGPAALRVRAKTLAASRASRRSTLLLALVSAVALGAFARREMNVKDFDPYRELGVESGASASAVQKAYRQLSLKNHPDRGGDERVFKRITRAYHTLTKEADRKNYERFGNPEGVFEEKFGSMKGASKLQASALMLGYLGAFVAVIAASAMYVSRKRTVDEEEATLPTYLRAVRRALRAVDCVEALPGAPRGLADCPVPSEEDFKGQLVEGQPPKFTAGPAAARHGLAFDKGKWVRAKGEGAANPDLKGGAAAAAAEAAAAAAAHAPPAGSLPAAARGASGAQEFLDFYEPRFERVAKCLGVAGLPAIGGAGAGAAEVQAFYAAWQGAVAGGKLASSSIDYFDNFRKELRKEIGEEAAAAELARDDKQRWAMLQVAYGLDKKKERKAADEARLAALVQAAAAHDPRLPAKSQ
jgi:curved DNA-binding protein CbpA